MELQEVQEVLQMLHGKQNAIMYFKVFLDFNTGETTRAIATINRITTAAISQQWP